MGEFFDRFKDREAIEVTLDDIIPGPYAKKEEQEKAVYKFYIKSVKKRGLSDELRIFRQKALGGGLNEKDFAAMNEIFEIVKSHARKGGYFLPSSEEGAAFLAYARVNSYAMLFAQILFVDRVIREGLMELIHGESARDVIDGVAAFALASSSENGGRISDDEARFYAAVVLLQTLFDRIFAVEGKVIDYRKDENGAHTGEFERTNAYDLSTSYLELANRREIEAGEAEKALCHNITTGWSQGIDSDTWDKLNAYYYSARSPYTGEPNLFTRHYDEYLEKLLPQFPYSKVRLAETLLKDISTSNGVRILEIGAGSGAFAIDLFMACKRLDIPLSRIRYHGVEPSKYMISNFEKNILRKLELDQLPADWPAAWALTMGSIEDVTKIPSLFLPRSTPNIIVFSCSIHHCFRDSVLEFFNNPEIKEHAESVYVLDAVKEHGWTKMHYMWADCESPENFDNIDVSGSWNSETLFTEPSRPIGDGVTNAWARVLKRT